MTPEQIQILEASIKRKIKSTREAIGEFREMSKPVAPENAIGRITRMDAINNKGVMEAALKQAEAKLGRLLEAESKLDSNDFCLCSECSEPISFERLKVMPDTSKCMKCM